MVKQDGNVDGGFDNQSTPAGEFAPAITWHTGIETVVPGKIWTIRGATKINGKINFPATCTLARDDATGDLVMFNSLRFDDEMNKKIMAMVPMRGRLHVVRLGSYHGKYDSYWRLGPLSSNRCSLWIVEGMKLQDGLKADHIISPNNLPLTDSRLFLFDLPKPEAVVTCHGPKVPGGFAIFTDAVLNINSYDHVDFAMRPIISLMGFRKAVNSPDPNWAKWMAGKKGMSTKEHVLSEYKRLLLEHPFDSYSSGHGPAVIGGAHDKIREKVTKRFG